MGIPTSPLGIPKSSPLRNAVGLAPWAGLSPYPEISLLHDEPCLFRLSFTLYAAVSMSRGGDTQSSSLTVSYHSYAIDDRTAASYAGTETSAGG